MNELLKSVTLGNVISFISVAGIILYLIISQKKFSSFSAKVGKFVEFTGKSLDINFIKKLIAFPIKSEMIRVCMEHVEEARKNNERLMITAHKEFLNNDLNWGDYYTKNKIPIQHMQYIREAKENTYKKALHDTFDYVQDNLRTEIKNNKYDLNDKAFYENIERFIANCFNSVSEELDRQYNLEFVDERKKLYKYNYYYHGEELKENIKIMFINIHDSILVYNKKIEEKIGEKINE